MRKVRWVVMVLIFVGLVVIGYGKHGLKADEVSVTPKAGEVKINPKDGAEMVWVPAGEFLMGSTDAEIAQVVKENPGLKAEWFDDEKPQRKVYLDGYWIYKYEVTVAQYRKFCEETGRKMPKAPSWGWEDKHPIVNVDWEDVVAYAKWAGCRLPTEAEWEKAARGTDGRRYPWGDKWDKEKCNSWELGKRRTMPVGSFSGGIGPYGCHDMAGNVWEWCADWYGEDYYAHAPSRNPRDPEKGEYRVLRGGGWDGHAINCRCADRIYNNPVVFWSGFGFRPARQSL